jgi:pantothenate kinase type III
VGDAHGDDAICGGKPGRGLSAEHAFAQASKLRALQLKDLPASVQKTVQETLKGGVIRNIAKEKEAGIEQ